MSDYNEMIEQAKIEAAKELQDEARKQLVKDEKVKLIAKKTAKQKFFPWRIRFEKVDKPNLILVDKDEFRQYKAYYFERELGLFERKGNHTHMQIHVYCRHCGHAATEIRSSV